MYEKASKNYGIFAVRYGPEVGLTARAIRARASREHWRQPHPGVVVLPGSTWDHRAAIAAAQAYLGERAAAGGMSAAWLYRLVPQPPQIPHLLVPHGVHVTTPGVAMRRSRHLTDADRSQIHGLSVVSVTFLMTSLAAHMTIDRLRALALDARQRGLLDIIDVAVRLEEMPRIPGRRRLVQVLKELEAEGSDSMFEYRVRQRLLDEGFVPSSAPVPVVLGAGRTVHLDVAFVRERVAIECRGFLAHSSRRQLNRDARRENAIALANEWLILKLTWDRFTHDWPAFIAELRAALDARPPAERGGRRPVWSVGAPDVR
jgi:hypothetical protein